MTTTKAYLMRVLDASHRSRGSRNQKDQAKARRLEALRFIIEHFPPGSARAGAPFAVGGPENETDIHGQLEAGIVVPFQAGFAGTARKAKATLLNAAQAEFKHRGVHVHDERIAIELGFLQGPRTLKVALIPGVEPWAGAYDPEGEEESKVLILFDRLTRQSIPVNFHRQWRMLQEQEGLLRKPIQLLKVWKHHARIQWNGLALEALVIEAFASRFAGEQTPERLLIHVLSTMRPKLLAEGGEDEVWRQILPSVGQLTLAEHFKRMLRALEQNDLEEVKKYFPMPQ